jgi:hypothetical protein
MGCGSCDRLFPSALYLIELEVVTELILGHKRLGEEFNYNYSKLKRKGKEEKAILATL